MEMVAFEVEVLICNFDATDGSLAVFGSGGETKLMTVWPPLTGRKNLTIELPFPAGETMTDSVDILETGNPIVYDVELSLMDSGFEIGVTTSTQLSLISTHIPRIRPGSVEFRDEKPFVYLLSTRSEVVRPDLVSDKADMLQLIWGSTEPTLPNAIWLPGCTWNEARNRLYQEVGRRRQPYRYLIFTDDDASLSLRPASAHSEYGTWPEVLDDPWREFERLLLLWEPAAGYARYTIQQPQETKQEEQDVECVRFADPLLVAYHYRPAAFLLPYTTEFDQESWWYSAVVVNNLAGVYFPGHVIQFNTLYVHDNQKSAGYAAFRQMNWERPMRWLLSAASSEQQISSFGLLNPIQVKCNETVRKRNAASYVVPAGAFDPCHPAVAHLRKPHAATTVKNCSGWSHEGKLFDMLFVRTERGEREREELMARQRERGERAEGEGERGGREREKELEARVEQLQRRVEALERERREEREQRGSTECERAAGHCEKSDPPRENNSPDGLNNDGRGGELEVLSTRIESLEAALEHVMERVVQLLPPGSEL